MIRASRDALNPVLRGEISRADAGFEASGDAALATGFWEYFDNDVFSDHVSVR